MRTLCAQLLLLYTLLTGPAGAHEFWFKPVDNPQRLNSVAPLQLEVGEYFSGDLVGFSAAATVSIRQYANKAERNLVPLLPAQGAVATLPLRLDIPGTHMVAFEGQPTNITLPADTFHAYLHDEGLDFIKAQREAAGTLTKPGRERYRRFVKTLIAAESAAATDTAFSVQTGLRLEIVPLNNPLRMKPGDALGLRVLYERKALAGALVKAWHKRTGETVMVRATTNNAGEVSVHLPYAGAWMVSVVHMVPAVMDADVDWDSFWGNLSFALP